MTEHFSRGDIMHILIWMIYLHGTAQYSGSAEFKSLKSCEAAKAAIEQKYADVLKNWERESMVQCVPK